MVGYIYGRQDLPFSSVFCRRTLSFIFLLHHQIFSFSLHKIQWSLEKVIHFSLYSIWVVLYLCLADVGCAWFGLWIMVSVSLSNAKNFHFCSWVCFVFMFWWVELFVYGQICWSCHVFSVDLIAESAYWDFWFCVMSPFELWETQIIWNEPLYFNCMCIIL